MDIAAFHLRLLGVNPAATPEQFWLTDQLRRLYKGFPDLRGFDDATADEGRFLGAFVMALAQTQAVYPVYLILPKARMKWAFDQIEAVSRHIFRVRKSQRDGVKTLRDALRQIRATSRAVAGAEPERWSMFGFSSKDPLLPAWAEGRLLASD